MDEGDLGSNLTTQDDYQSVHLSSDLAASAEESMYNQMKEEGEACEEVKKRIYGKKPLRIPGSCSSWLDSILLNRRSSYDRHDVPILSLFHSFTQPYHRNPQ